MKAQIKKLKEEITELEKAKLTLLKFGEKMTNEQIGELYNIAKKIKENKNQVDSLTYWSKFRRGEFRLEHAKQKKEAKNKIETEKQKKAGERQKARQKEIDARIKKRLERQKRINDRVKEANKKV